MTGSPSTATPVQISPTIYPPGYGFSEAFYNQVAPSLVGAQYPTYPGRLDPGMSPTAAMAMRAAQDYSVTPFGNLAGSVQGSIGRFMNPSYLNPRQGLQPPPDYGFGNYDFSKPQFMPASPTAMRPPPQYGKPPTVARQGPTEPGGLNRISAKVGSTDFGGSEGTPPGRLGGDPSALADKPGGAIKNRGWPWIPGQNPQNPQSEWIEPWGGYNAEGEWTGAGWRTGWTSPYGPSYPSGPGGGGGGGGGPGGGDGGESAPAPGGPGGRIPPWLLPVGSVLAGALGGGGGGGGGGYFGGGGNRPVTPTLSGALQPYQPMPGGAGFLEYSPGNQALSFGPGMGSQPGAPAMPNAPIPLGPPAAPSPGGGGAPGGIDPGAIIPQNSLSWLGRYSGPNRGKSWDETVFDNWTRGWHMGDYQPSPELINAAREAGMPYEFGSRPTYAHELPGYQGNQVAQRSASFPVSGNMSYIPPSGGGNLRPAGSLSFEGSPQGGPGGGLNLSMPQRPGGGLNLSMPQRSPGNPAAPTMPAPPVYQGPGQGPADPFGPTNAMDLYRSAAPVIQQEMRDRISEAMAQSGLTGARFSSAAQTRAAEEGARAGLRQNELMGRLLYGQTQADLDRSLTANDQAMRMLQLQDELTRNRITLPFQMGQWEQGRQDAFANQSFQDWSQNRLGFIPFLAQLAAGAGNAQQGQFGTQQTAGSPGLLDYVQAFAPYFYGYQQYG